MAEKKIKDFSTKEAWVEYQDGEIIDLKTGETLPSKPDKPYRPVAQAETPGKEANQAFMMSRNKKLTDPYAGQFYRAKQAELLADESISPQQATSRARLKHPNLYSAAFGEGRDKLKAALFVEMDAQEAAGQQVSEKVALETVAKKLPREIQMHGGVF